MLSEYGATKFVVQESNDRLKVGMRMHDGGKERLRKVVITEGDA